MRYGEAILDFEARKPSVIKLTLDRIAAITEFLSHPENIYPSIHIAGTNGKGSTAAFTAGILKNSGLRVGLYTSPHLISPRERISIDGVDISEDDFAGYYAKILALEPQISSGALTYFEIITAMAFDYFADQKIDIAVLETGLGGRFDATNIVTPVVSVITRVAMDHQRWLGDSLADIALEKCGIIKHGIPVVTIRQDDVVMRAIEDTSGALNAPLRICEPLPEHTHVGLEGAHQLENAALAVAASQVALRQKWDPSALPVFVRDALVSARWPGRLQKVAESPLTLIDGAHNPNGVRALVEHLKSTYPDHRKILVVSMMHDKSLEEMLSIMSEVADRWATVALPLERAEDPSTLASLIRHFSDKEVAVYPSLEIALSEINESASNDDVICIAGSLYLVAEFLSL